MEHKDPITRRADELSIAQVGLAYALALALNATAVVAFYRLASAPEHRGGAVLLSAIPVALMLLPMLLVCHRLAVAKAMALRSQRQ